MAYNKFLVDKAIGSLEQSLSQVATVQNVNDMQNLRFFMDDLLVTELSEKDADPKKFTGLEFSKSIASEAKDFRQVRDVKFILQDVLSERQKQRKGWLKMVDQIVLVVKGWFGVSGRLSGPSLSIRQGRDLSSAEKKTYDQARQNDQNWQITRAIRLYEKLSQNAYDARDLVDIHLDLSYAYAKVGRYDKAQSLLSRIENQYKGAREEGVADILLKRVQGLQELTGERDRLLDILVQTKENFELQQLYFKIGILNYRLFDFQKAAEAFKNAATVIPDNQQAVKALFYLGVTLKFHSKLEPAIEVFEELMDRFPKSEYAVYSRYQLADTHRKTGDYEKSAQEFREIPVDFPQASIAPLSQFRAGYVYFYDLGDPTRAADCFDQLKELFPDNRIARYSTQELSPYARSMVRDFAFILLRKGLYADARRAFEQAIENDRKDAWSHSGFATTLSFLGERRKSIQIAIEAVKMNTDEYTLGALGYVYELNGQYQNAIYFYRKSLKVRGNYLSVLYNLGRLQEFAGEYEEAIKSYQKVVELSGDVTGKAEIYINLGHAYWYVGKFMDAEDQFKKALELSPDSLVAHYNLGVTYQAENKKDLAEHEFRKVLSLKPTFRQAEIGLELLKRKK